MVRHAALQILCKFTMIKDSLINQQQKLVMLSLQTNLIQNQQPANTLELINHIRKTYDSAFLKKSSLKTCEVEFYLKKDTAMSKLSNMDCINICATKMSTLRHFTAFCCHDTPNYPALSPASNLRITFSFASSFKSTLIVYLDKYKFEKMGYKTDKT